MKKSEVKKPEIKSIYSEDGKYLKHIPSCETIGDLKQLLDKLPNELPIRVGMDEGVKIVWFNVGQVSEHIAFEDNDGCFDV